MKNYNVILIFFLFSLGILGCGPKPEIFISRKLDFTPTKSVAILPFNNYSGKEDAGKQVANAFLIELLKKPFFNIIEPGQVDRVMREQRIRSSDQIDSVTATILGDSLGVDYVLIGAVNEFEYSRIGDRDIPVVGFSARLLDTDNGRIIWAAYHTRKGDDKELILNWGLVSSLSRLTRDSVHEVAKRIKSRN